MSTLFFAREHRPFAVHIGEGELLLRIPYSIHSSREELEAFIDYIEPARVVPLIEPIIGGPSSWGSNIVVQEGFQDLQSSMAGAGPAPTEFEIAERTRQFWQQPVEYSQDQLELLALLDDQPPKRRRFSC